MLLGWASEEHDVTAEVLPTRWNMYYAEKSRVTPFIYGIPLQSHDGALPHQPDFSMRLDCVKSCIHPSQVSSHQWTAITALVLKPETMDWRKL